MKLLAYSKWDVVPVVCGLVHFAFVLTLFAVFPIAPWWLLIGMGFTYSVSISWNINGISHNFLHNPYFQSHLLNRIFSLTESLAMGFSQTFYEYVHQRHHMGNSDRPDAETGDTIDWLSAIFATTRRSFIAKSRARTNRTPSGAYSRSRPFSASSS
jgi:fatty acid desaturase